MHSPKLLIMSKTTATRKLTLPKHLGLQKKIRQKGNSKSRGAQKPPIRVSGTPHKLNAHTSDTRNRALAALGRMRRDNLSLSEACRQEHIKPATFLRYVGSAVRQDRPGGPYRATAGDSFRRDLRFPTAQGEMDISVYGIKNARMISNYLNAVSEYFRTGKRAKLDSFKGQTIKVNGKNIKLLTDPANLLPLAEANVFHLDQLYASATGRG
jgi:hypothetical protein